MSTVTVMAPIATVATVATVTTVTTVAATVITWIAVVRASYKHRRCHDHRGRSAIDGWSRSVNYLRSGRIHWRRRSVNDLRSWSINPWQRQRREWQSNGYTKMDASPGRLTRCQPNSDYR